MAGRKSGNPKVIPDLSPLAKTAFVPMLKSSFCQYGPGAAHIFCVNPTCDCTCHQPDN